MFVLANMWFQTLMRTFFFNIDKIVFNFISMIYDFLITIARTSVLSQADILNMADRIYKLLAIFMIFKVTFSLIMYVVNPDDFSDKSKGVTKLGTNIVISLALLILTPYIFNYAYQFQTIILEDNSLSAVIFGADQGNSAESPFESAGDSMAYITMAPFFMPNVAIDELYECAQLTTRDSNENIVFNEACSGLNSDYESTNDSDSMDAIVSDKQALKNYVAGVSKGNLGLMFRQDIAIATNEDNTDYIIEYKYLFSTVLGIIIIFLLVTFCMDVALRSIKLAFLQLVAPIPIISYVDPKSGKDGMFKKWVDMCIKTYISLFIRLLAIYFAAYIISRIDRMVDIIDGSYVSNLLVKIIIIIGALMFAKQLPKILEGLGIKLDGDGKFYLNPLKKFEDQALGGKRFTGMAGTLAAGTIDRAARIATAPGAKGKLGALLGAGPGILGSAARGFRSNAGFSGGMKKQAQVNRRLREGRINGLSPVASYLDYAGSVFGLDDASLEKESTLIRRYEDEASRIKDSIAQQTLNHRQSITKEQERQKTMKATSDARKNIKAQGDRMMNVAKDVANKKGNMGTSYISAADKISLGNFNFTESEKRAMIKLGIHVPASASDVSSADFDRLYDKGRSLNYTSNRIANESNLQKIQAISENGGQLTEDLTIYGANGNNYTFRAGTKITGDDYALAKEKVGNYDKESTKAIFDALSANDEDLSASVRSGEAISFKNISDEYKKSVGDAENVSKAYNKEYANDTDFAAITETLNSTISYDDVKQNINDMENDASTTRINNKIRNSNNEIEKLNREINEIENSDSNYIDYEDERGQKYHITIKEYDERVKLRKAKLDREKKRRQERRSLFINRN